MHVNIWVNNEKGGLGASVRVTVLAELVCARIHKLFRLSTGVGGKSASGAFEGLRVFWKI